MTSQEAAQATITHQADVVAARILVADDEPGIRAFIGRALLEAAGYAADLAATGSQALRQALDSDYDLVILDLVMPDMAGQVVLERLLAARPDQAVLVLSCLADVASKVECLERGAQDYLTKPFSLARGAEPGAELTEVPLMAAMFLAMAWHARRKLAAEHESRLVGEENARLLDTQRRFLQDASHQLRTPITIALGHAELLARGLVSDQEGHDIQVVLDELNRLRRIAERLLVIAAAEGPEFLRLEPVALDSFTMEILRRWRPTADRRWQLGRLDRPPCRPTGSGSAWRSTRYLRTPSGTPRTAASSSCRSWRPATACRPGWSSRTPARASPPDWSATSSTGSAAATAGSRGEPAWDWRWCVRSRGRTAERSSCAAAPVRAASSNCSSPGRRGRWRFCLRRPRTRTLPVANWPASRDGANRA
jgi:CheY-like chemotaxis protein